MNKNSFSTKIGVNPTVTHNIIKGRNAPSYDVLTKILLTFSDINANWLLGSDDSMMKNTYITTENTITNMVNEEKTPYHNNPYKNESEIINFLKEQLKTKDLENTNLNREIGKLQQKISELTPKQ